MLTKLLLLYSDPENLLAVIIKEPQIPPLDNGKLISFGNSQPFLHIRDFLRNVMAAVISEQAKIKKANSA